MLKIIKVAIIHVALVLGIDSYVNAQAPAKSTQIKTADSLFLAGDYAHAKTAYKSLVNDTSKNGRWWNRL